MSYILDALKKAESERKLGSIPNVHASQVTTTALDHNASIWTRPVTWIGFALVAATLVVLAWRQPWQAAPTPAPVTAPLNASAADVPPPTVKAAAPIAAQPAPPVVQSRPVIAPPTPKPITPEPAKRQADARPPVPPASAKPTQTAAVADAARPAVNAPAPAPAANPAAPPTDSNVMTQRELPDNIQRELPALTISGYIYSSNPAERSILINRVLRREGDEVAPGLTLEKMMPKSAVMSYRGYRYRMSY